MRKLLSKSEAATLVNLHTVSVMRLVRQGHFPKPIKLSPSKNSRVRFTEEDIERWLQSRRDESGNTSASTRMEARNG